MLESRSKDDSFAHPRVGLFAGGFAVCLTAVALAAGADRAASPNATPQFGWMPSASTNVDRKSVPGSRLLTGDAASRPVSEMAFERGQVDGAGSCYFVFGSAYFRAAVRRLLVGVPAYGGSLC
jgi:hypothetical protein